MIRKDDLKDAMQHECDIAIHLHGKVPAGALDYRPSPGQRSTLELMRYLAGCGIGAARARRDGDWAGYKEVRVENAAMGGEGFPAAMAKQKAALGALLDGLDDEALATQEATLPWGEKVTLGRALVETSLKWLTAYRMQLFLYAKAAGNEKIGTANNWGGVDSEPEA